VANCELLQTLNTDGADKYKLKWNECS